MSESDHETVSFAAFLDYRGRRLHAPVIATAPAPPDVVTTPPDAPGPDATAAAKALAPSS
jgi:hypothetical protein